MVFLRQRVTRSHLVWYVQLTGYLLFLLERVEQQNNVGPVIKLPVGGEAFSLSLSLYVFLCLSHSLWGLWVVEDCGCFLSGSCECLSVWKQCSDLDPWLVLPRDPIFLLSPSAVAVSVFPDPSVSVEDWLVAISDEVGALNIKSVSRMNKARGHVSIGNLL